MFFFSELHGASHLPQKLPARLKGQRGLHQMELCLALGHSKLGILYVTVYMAGTVYPNMGYIAVYPNPKRLTRIVFLSSSRNPI